MSLVLYRFVSIRILEWHIVVTMCQFKNGVIVTLLKGLIKSKESSMPQTQEYLYAVLCLYNISF